MPGSVDRGLFAFLPQPFAPILRLADEVHEVLLVAFGILGRVRHSRKIFEKID